MTHNRKYQGLSARSNVDTVRATAHLFNLFEVFRSVKGMASC